jgi:putative nucleotidyltransferase with HDIG domain
VGVTSPVRGFDGGSSQRERVRALVERVAETCDLPALPAVAARALALARDRDARVDDLARLVMTDAALAARVLKISRSVLYVRREPPATLRQAILTVGFGALRKILIAASARSVFRADDAVAQRLWEHALATALATDELAALAGEPRGGASFIAGLLHDVGRLIFHLSQPAAFAALEGGEEAEVAAFGVTHATVGGCLAARWGLEDEVVEAIMLHHAPGMSPLAARLAAADRIARAIGCGSGGGEVETPGSAGAGGWPELPEDTRRRAGGDLEGGVRSPDGGAGESPTALSAVGERVAVALCAERTLFD